MEESQPSKTSRKGLIIIVIVVLLIAAAVAAYFLTKDSNETDNSNTTANTQSTPPAQSSASAFAPAATANEPFVATLNTNVNGKNVKGIMTSDGQGNVSYSYDTDGNKMTLTYTKDAYYICNASAGCFKYNVSGENNSGFDPSDYQYDASKIASYKNNAVSQGQQACPVGGGTCDVWSVTVGAIKSTMYVNKDSKRIIKVTSTNGSTSSDISYEYKKATVVVPQNAVTLPTGQ